MANIAVYDGCPQSGDTTFDLKPPSFCCDARSSHDHPFNCTLGAALPQRTDLNAPAARCPHPDLADLIRDLKARLAWRSPSPFF
ncbi:hypothetical protein ACVWYQ_006378 [Bradyrhizobium sp. USDA 3397]